METRLKEIRDHIDNDLDRFGDAAYLLEQLQQSQDGHYCTLNCLKGVLEQLKGNVDRQVVIQDIEQYFTDLGEPTIKASSSVIKIENPFKLVPKRD